MLLIDVLDDQYLELTWQGQKSQKREQQHAHPAGGPAGYALQAHGVGQLRHGRGLREQGGRPLEQHEGDEDTHRQKRHQLDQRLDRNGRDHSLVALAGIQMPSAEQNDEHGQYHGDPERTITPEPLGGQGRVGTQRVIHQHRMADRDRLELQRDIRRDGDQGHKGHQGTQQRALSVTGTDEVGNGGDPLLSRNAHHLAQRERRQQHGQRWPQIDQQEARAKLSGSAHAAVKGPGGTVDRNGERIHRGRANQRAPLFGAAVSPGGYHEQQRQVAEGSPNHHQVGTHAHRRPGVSTSQAVMPISAPQTTNR